MWEKEIEREKETYAKRENNEQRVEVNGLIRIYIVIWSCVTPNI